LPNQNELVLKEIDSLKSNHTDTALQAIKNIKQTGVSAVPILIDTLQESDDESLQTMAVIVLGELGELAKEAIPSLANLLCKGNEQMRMATALSLFRIGSSALLSLQQVIKGGDDSARFWACWASTLIDPTSVNEEVVNILKNVREYTENPIEQVAAEEALGKIIAYNLLDKHE
jgi:HEAT repeat protein